MNHLHSHGHAPPGDLSKIGQHHNLSPKIKKPFFSSALLDIPLWKLEECFSVFKCKQLQKRQRRMR